MLEIEFSLATSDQLHTIVDLIDAGAAQPSQASTERNVARLHALFAAIEADPNHQLWLAAAENNILGTFMLSFLPTLAYGGGWRGQLESVHVHPDHRGRGIGTKMLAHAVGLSRQKGCTQLQLTSNKSRVDAHRFYERHGFTRSHEGFKLTL